MAVGRISGPLLKNNLLRDGVDLAFETDLLYLDVTRGRIGIKTSTPTDELQVNGTTRTTNLKVDTQADIGTGGNKFTITGNTISSTNAVISIEPTGSNPVVYQNKLQVGDLIASSNIIESLTDINFNTAGTGNVNIYANVLVNGDVHATGNITADGDIVIGDANTDSIAFNADIISNLIPDVTNTYTLGSTSKKWKDIYVDNIYANGVTTGDIVVGGVNLILPQGNTIYVATTGADDNSGTHEHDPFRTIKRACAVATAGTTIFIYPGEFEEIFPIDVPPGVTVHGASLRSVLIKPTAATMFLDAFHMSGEATVEDVTITGFHHDPLGSAPEFPINNQGTGHAFRFTWGATVTGRSPYIRNITVITFGTASVLAIASQKTETIAGLTRIKNIIDELVVNGSITKTPANPLNPNTSLTASNGATGIALQNLIDDVIYVINNGTLRADLPTINANGASVSTGVLSNAAVILAANKEFLKEEITAYVTATYPAPGFVYDIPTCKRDMGYIVDALVYDITRGGNEHSVYAGIAHWVQPANDPRGYARADAGHGALVDGGAVSSTSKEAAMLFHSVTFITPAADTLIATNGARIEWLNSFTYFAGRGLYAYSSPEGFAQAGLTRLRINTRTGTWAVGNTVNYYDTDGTTVLGTGVIASIDGNFVNLTGRCLGFETITDRTPTTIYVNGNAKLSTSQKKFGASSLALDGVGDYISHPTTPDFAFPSTISRIAKTITVNGNAAVSATQSKFGGSSIAFDGTGDYLSIATDTDYGFGTGDFTIEGWFYKTVVATQYLFDTRTTLTENSVAVQSQGNGTLRLSVNGVFVLTSSNAHTNNAWNHLAISRASGVTRFFINGVVSTTTYTDTTNYGTTKPLVVGAQYNGTTAFAGYIDDFRVSNTARYTATFTPTTTAFVDDFNTKLLVNGNSTIIDDASYGTATDFTIEGWIYPTAGSAYQSVFDFRSAAIEKAIFLGVNTSNQIYLYVNGVITITTAATVSLSTWTHVALVRRNASTKIYLNGTQSGSSWADITSYGTTNPLRIGADWTASYGFTGYIDDVKISKGVARYTTTFTAPTIALTGDLATVLLLHFNGNNNSTTILDDGITFQDLRTSAGGTGTIINFADYSDFGAEIRAIGSANIYGDYGAYGDGIGVIAYLVSQNFAYIGSGKVLTNDPNDRIGANEVVELNGARIYRTSVDNEGNFQVGNSFYVNQKTGDVLFDSQNLSVTSATGVTFTDGVNTTTITPNDLTTGNIRIHDNNIDSLTGDVIVTAASGAINLQNNTFVTGNLEVTGDVNIGGNITIGDNPTDTVSFVAGINSNLVPATTATYDLGTTSLRWNNTYLSRLEVDGLVIDNNTVSTTVGNDNLILTANGTGIISIPSNDVLIDQNLTVTQDLTVTTGTTFLKDTTIVGTMTYTGAITQTGDTTITGNYEVTGHITSTGYLQLPQVRIENNVVSTTTTNTDLELQANGTGNVVIEGIKISDNNIQSVATNSNITLTPQGTGSVIINSNQSLQIPVGTSAQRPGTLAGTTATTGMIRYNTDLAQYEGYNGTYWIKLSGVQDLDGNTYIKAESTLGANDNTLYFYADNNLMVTIDATKMFAERLQTSNLDLNGNTITSITTNSNLNLTATGTGAVRVGNLRIYNNTITNISNNAVTEFNETGSGYVKIAGTNGFVIPSGNGFLERPLSPEVGMTRFNTDGQLVEVYNGVTWGSVAGASGGVTSVEANELGIAAALILG